MRRVCGALVALTAVFLLHGVQCAGHDSAPWVHQGATSTLTLHGAAASGLHHSPSTGRGAPSAVVSDRAAAGIAGTQQPGPSSGDLWAVCLAVLSVGLALLVALLLRAGPLLRRSWARVWAQRWISAPALLRPPDPFTLCVLRN